MTTAVEDRSIYNGKKVIVVRDVPEQNEAVEVEGTVQVANESGVLIKPKGKTTFDLIPAGEIIEIRLAPEKDKKIGRKTLKPVELGQARAHLLERHGFTLTAVNDLEEQAAYEQHARIDHVASDLGHVHGDKSDTKRGEALDEAEAAVEGDEADDE